MNVFERRTPPTHVLEEAQQFRDLFLPEAQETPFRKNSIQSKTVTGGRVAIVITPFRHDWIGSDTSAIVQAAFLSDLSETRRHLFTTSWFNVRDDGTLSSDYLNATAMVPDLSTSVLTTTGDSYDLIKGNQNNLIFVLNSLAKGSVRDDATRSANPRGKLLQIVRAETSFDNEIVERAIREVADESFLWQSLGGDIEVGRFKK